MSEKYKGFCDYCAHDGNPGICDKCGKSLIKDGEWWIPTEFCNLKGFDIKPKQTEDLVNHPSHYQTKSGLETIQVIEAFTEDLKGAEAVYTANVIKYICRWKKKNGLQDLKKALWYLTKLIEHVEKGI